MFELIDVRQLEAKPKPGRYEATQHGYFVTFSDGEAEYQGRVTKGVRRWVECTVVVTNGGVSVENN